MAPDREAIGMELSDFVNGHVRPLRSQCASDVDVQQTANAIKSWFVSMS